jgi:predicted ATPase
MRPLTILIGPNDSGKTAFLKAAQCLASPAIDTHDYWRLESRNSIQIWAQVQGKKVIFSSEEGHSLQDSGGKNPLKPWGFYQLPVQGVPMTSSGYPDSGAAPSIRSNGEDVPALLDHLLRRDRNRFFEIRNALRRLIPGFEELEIATPEAAKRRVDLVIDNGLSIPADRSSAGVRLLLFFVALAYHPNPPKLILIEEPENGVHPKRLEDVARLLREITQGVHGNNAAQVVLTTHSPHLLDFVDIEKDQVLVFRRNDDGSRSAEPADAERLKNFLDEFMLGEVWFNEGEAGLVGGGK